MDEFKEAFKYFKQKHDPEVLQRAIHFEFQNVPEDVIPLTEFLGNAEQGSCALCLQLGLVPHQQWSVYTLKDIKGLFIISNPFSVKGQQHWIKKCLETYPRKPSATNLDLHYKFIDDIWSLQKDHDPIRCTLMNKLSWATLGYHHNWNTKIYDRSNYSPFPDCLSKLTRHIASSLYFKTFKPEAAIVNYYNNKSSLGIHNDHSEMELSEPIISISFGQTAIFLVGTQLKTEKPIAMLLKSGDIVILSGPSRLAYHAVPKIFQDSTQSRYSSIEDDSWKHFHDYIQNHRVNISVGQVYPANV